MSKALRHIVAVAISTDGRRAKEHLAPGEDWPCLAKDTVEDDKVRSDRLLVDMQFEVDSQDELGENGANEDASEFFMNLAEYVSHRWTSRYKMPYSGGEFAPPMCVA